MHNFEDFLLPPIRPTSLDEHWMLLALRQAVKGYGLTRPNPMVGVVIVQNSNTLVAAGYHRYFGGAHAELDALAQCPKDLDWSQVTLYCTLEPCCHLTKKTPPCLPLVLEKKIPKVVLAMTDPNPAVAGKSIAALRAAGVEVVTGVLEKQARHLSRAYLKQEKHSSPYIHLKMATTLDGSFGPDQTSGPNWMTNQMAKDYVHNLRAGHSAIVVGRNTYDKDRPQLNVRLPYYEEHTQFIQPAKIVVSQKLAESAPKGPILFSSINDLLKSQYQSLLIEAGPTLQSALLESNTFDELSIILTPKILGNKNKILFSRSLSLAEALSFSGATWYPMGEDLLFHWVRPIVGE